MTAPTEDLPLSDPERTLLNGFLLQNDEILNNLERIDGFFSALICASDQAVPNDYLTGIWGEARALETPLQLLELVALMNRHWNTTAMDLAHAATMNMPPVLLMMARNDGRLSSGDWALGFMLGTQSHEGWEALQRDEQAIKYLLPILELSAEALPDEVLAGVEREALTGDEQTAVQDKLVESVMFFYQYFRSASLLPVEPVVSPGSKTGRNERCPYGSGKKFKQCCAQ